MKRRSGISLVELTIVMLVIGIIGGMGSLKYADALDAHRSRQMASLLTESLEQYKHGASIRSANVTVTFQKNKSIYTVTGLPNPSHPSKPYLVDLATICPGVRASDNDVITFNGFGYPTAAHTVELKAGGEKWHVKVAADGQISAALQTGPGGKQG